MLILENVFILGNVLNEINNPVNDSRSLRKRDQIGHIENDHLKSRNFEIVFL